MRWRKMNIWANEISLREQWKRKNRKTIRKQKEWRSYVTTKYLRNEKFIGWVWNYLKMTLRRIGNFMKGEKWSWV